MPGNQKDDSDTFRVLLATDIHLGYDERDPMKGNDSLVTFEEILVNAQKHSVDFILLGGDLFHENKPSRRILHGCLSLLRKYCLGDKPVQFEFQSDQSVNFEHCQFPTLNYEDPNFNISIPVFSIHGNHDDPTGPGNLCSLDIIHSAGFINYFGKTTSLEKITVSPLLMQKGSTKLALYGLGSIRDERLHRLFLKKNVAMLRPRENKDDWFNMFVFHQNRSKHSDTNYIPEQFLDDFLDLVVWGHEHECRIVPELNGVQNFYITQPGSSIATSLSEGETKPKHIGLLQIRGKDFKVTPIPLQTVRQFYLEDIVLNDTSLNPNDPNVGKKVEAFCQEKVERLLEKAESEHSGHRKQPKEPIVRLRIDYTGFDTFSIYRFGRHFMNRVANPDQMIIFHQKRKLGMKSQGSNEDLELLANLNPQSLDTARVEDMVRDYFSKVEANQQLQVLTEKGMSEAVKEFVDKEEREAISELVKYQLQKTQKYLKVRNTDEEAIDTEVVRYKNERRIKQEEDQEVQVALQRAQSLRGSEPDNQDSRVNSDSDPEPSTSAQTRGRGRGRGRGSSSSRASKSSGDFGEDTSTPPRRGRGSLGDGRGRGKAPVVMEMGSRSVRDMLIAGNQQQSLQHKNRKAASVILDISDEDDAVCISDEDDMLSIPSSRRKQSQGQKSKSKSKVSTKRVRGAVFDSDDDSDEGDYVPGKRRR